MKLKSPRILQIAWLAMAACFVLLGPAVTLAAKAPVSQGYAAKDTILDGSLVSLEATNYQSIEQAAAGNRALLVGIAINPSQSLLAYSNGSSTIQVASAGVVSTLVSTANGDIKSGDPLSVSPIAGVAMKASQPGKIIGTAQKDFVAGDNTAKQSVDLKDNDGRTQTVYVGRIDVDIHVQDWAPEGEKNSPALTGLRTFLSNAVGKPVSNTQALLAVGVIVIAILSSGIILYSSISSSIYSIGRNPLSKGIIRRSLFIMVGLAIVVVVGAGSAVYLLLGG